MLIIYFFATLSAITGTIITAVPRGGSMHTTVSIINIYKEGNLAIQQAGKSMSTKIVILCKKCPSVKRGEYQRCQVPVGAQFHQLPWITLRNAPSLRQTQ